MKKYMENVIKKQHKNVQSRSKRWRLEEEQSRNRTEASKFVENRRGVGRLSID